MSENQDVPGLEFPFQYFPLDYPEYKEQIWTQHAPLDTLAALLEDPHAWIRSRSDRAPEQLLGRRSHSILIQFIYPAEPLAPDTFVVAGVLGNNTIAVYVPARHPGQVSADVEFFGAVARERVQELTVVLHDGLAFASHHPFEPQAGQRPALEYITRAIQSPSAYLQTLNNERFFRLIASAPHPGYVVNPQPPLKDSLKLALAGGNLQGIRFLFQWTRPVSYAGGEGGENEPPTLKRIHLMGTYNPGAQAEALEITVDTLASVDEREIGPPSPPGLTTQKPSDGKGKKSRKERREGGTNAPPLKPNTKKRRK